MSDDLDIVGTVSEDIRSTPIDQGSYFAEAVRADVADTSTWDLDPKTGKMVAPFGRVRWRILAGKLGEETAFAGRQTEQRVNLTAGKFVDSMGRERNNLDNLAQLIRLKHGLPKGADVRGFALFQTSDLGGLPLDERIATLSKRFSDAVIGLKAVVRIYHRKGDDGPQDAIAAVSVPEV